MLLLLLPVVCLLGAHDPLGLLLRLRRPKERLRILLLVRLGIVLLVGLPLLVIHWRRPLPPVLPARKV